MKSILCVSLLILLMPKRLRRPIAGRQRRREASCMTLTAWDATTLASTPARTDAFGL